MAQLWKIVGGADKGGVFVREGETVASPKSWGRISRGAIVEEVELIGERLHYKKLTGIGPNEGWISVVLNQTDPTDGRTRHRILAEQVPAEMREKVEKQKKIMEERKATKVKNNGNLVHVLAIGDSLTEGENASTFSDEYWAQLMKSINSTGYHLKPYPVHLEELLNKFGKGDVVYKVHNYGKCNDTTEMMAERLPGILGELEEQYGQPPEFVLIMGGTNDLVYQYTADDILANIERMISAVAEVPSTSVLFPIPGKAAVFSIAAQQVYATLREWASRKDGPLFADVSKVAEEHPEYLCDGIHFTTEGYAEFAKIAFDVLQMRLQQQ